MLSVRFISLKRSILCYLCFCGSIYWCPTQIVLCFCFICLRLVYPMLPVSLDCPFSIAPSVFSNVYLRLSYIMKVFMLLWLGRIEDNHQNKILNH